MMNIVKICANPVVDYAAEELKKYLRMMMPDGGDVAISYDPMAQDGFRLGLMENFGLDTSEALDLKLDDILHIDTDVSGGIISGSNPRSVLLAVYVRCYFLRQMLEAKLMGDMVGLSPVETLISMYVGFRLFGLAGFLLGPIGLLMIGDLVELYWMEYR